jgi:hypothetical protein
LAATLDFKKVSHQKKQLDADMVFAKDLLDTVKKSNEGSASRSRTRYTAVGGGVVR